MRIASHICNQLLAFQPVFRQTIANFR